MFTIIIIEKKYFFFKIKMIVNTITIFRSIFILFVIISYSFIIYSDIQNFYKIDYNIYKENSTFILLYTINFNVFIFNEIIDCIYRLIYTIFDYKLEWLISINRKLVIFNFIFFIIFHGFIYNSIINGCETKFRCENNYIFSSISIIFILLISCISTFYLFLKIENIQDDENIEKNQEVLSKIDNNINLIV